MTEEFSEEEFGEFEQAFHALADSWQERIGSLKTCHALAFLVAERVCCSYSRQAMSALVLEEASLWAQAKYYGKEKKEGEE